MHISQLCSQATHPICIHFPSTFTLLEIDTEGFAFFRDHARINLELHTHWIDFATQIQQQGQTLTLHFVLSKPEPPLIRFYTKLGTALEEQQISVLAISKAIYEKIGSISHPVLQHGEEIYELHADGTLQTSDQTITRKLRSIFQRSRPLHVVLSCK